MRIQDSARKPRSPQPVDLEERSLADYRGLTSQRLLDAVATAAEPLRSARVLHLNATAYGGGVAELLRSVVPVLRSLGIDADWRVVSGDESFFGVTKALHNGLQGGEFLPPAAAWSTYERTCVRNALLAADDYDFVVVHDPQPAGILPHCRTSDARWIWRCHIDTSAPDPRAWNFLRPFLHGYDTAVFTSTEYTKPDLPIRHVDVIPPAIDPLSAKNAELAQPAVTRIVAKLGIDVRAPLVTQVSRFDPWKDPRGVLDAYLAAREEVPELQLVLAGSMASDDPEAASVYEEIRAVGDPDPRIHVLTDLTDEEVNALQRFSAICIQKSLREGFGLVVSEAMWKRTPVVAGRTGGIPLQMADGAGGRLVDDVDSCASAMLELLRDPRLAGELAEAGHRRVREHFLLPRLVLNELLLLAATGGGRPARSHSVARDPVCGLAAGTDGETDESGWFCSDDCRDGFGTAAAERS